MRIEVNWCEEERKTYIFLDQTDQYASCEERRRGQQKFCPRYIKISNLTTPVLDIDLDARDSLRALFFCRSNSTERRAP